MFRLPILRPILVPYTAPQPTRRSKSRWQRTYLSEDGVAYCVWETNILFTKQVTERICRIRHLNVKKMPCHLYCETYDPATELHFRRFA